MANIIIGTAGHIDHGKTTLIKALTGRSTDTLKDEIKRGISINLGFTYFDLPSGMRAGIIDVPGHERFIKNMIAGATGIDLVLVTIDACEGIKPQTIEHLDILSYLNIKDALFVLTKHDLADEIMRELVMDDIRELQNKNPNGFYAKADIVSVDSISGHGLPELIAAIDTMAQNMKTRNEAAPARLHIDRVFSLRGFGTIVTGTLSEGIIRNGDELEVYPKNLTAKIRNVQVHDTNVDSAFAGNRTALNIGNLKVEQLHRGDVLGAIGSMRETNLLDVKISLVEHTDIELKMLSRIRVYMGAKEILARVVPLDVNTIKAGESAFCQLRLEEPAVTKKDDKFVIRNYSPMETIGGGIVLDPNPTFHRRSEKDIVDKLKVKESGETDDVTEDFVQSKGLSGVSVKQVAAYMSADETTVAEHLKELCENARLVIINNQYYHSAALEDLRVAILETLSDFHNTNPLKKGMQKAELRNKTSKQLKQKDYDAFLKLFSDEGLIKSLDGGITMCVSQHKIAYNPKQAAIRDEIDARLLNAGFSPPAIAELTAKDAERVSVFDSMVDVTIMRLDNDLSVHKTHYDRAKELLRDFSKTHPDGFTLGDFRDLLGTTRRVALAMLDDFDRKGITARNGDIRKINDNI